MRMIVFVIVKVYWAMQIMPVICDEIFIVKDFSVNIDDDVNV